MGRRWKLSVRLKSQDSRARRTRNSEIPRIARHITDSRMLDGLSKSFDWVSRFLSSQGEGRQDAALIMLRMQMEVVPHVTCSRSALCQSGLRGDMPPHARAR